MVKLIKAFHLFVMKVLFRINKRNRISLWQRLATMLEHNIKEYDALVELRERYRQRSRFYLLNETYCAIDSWITNMKMGQRFAHAIVGYVSLEEYLLLSVSENERNSVNALNSAVYLLKAQEKILKAICSSMTYPLALLSGTVALLYFFSIHIIPKINELQIVKSWQGPALRVINMSYFVKTYFVSIVLSLILFIVLFLISLPYFVSKIRTYLDQYPPYSIYRLFVGTSWLLSLSSLIARHVNVKDALILLKEDATPWLKSRIENTLFYYQKGQGLARSLFLARQHFPDEEVIEDLLFYEKFSHFNDAIKKIANDWLEISIEKINARLKTMFWVCLIISGLIIFTIVLGVLDMQQQLSLATQVAR